MTLGWVEPASLWVLHALPAPTSPPTLAPVPAGHRLLLLPAQGGVREMGGAGDAGGEAAAAGLLAGCIAVMMLGLALCAHSGRRPTAPSLELGSAPLKTNSAYVQGDVFGLAGKPTRPAPPPRDTPGPSAAPSSPARPAPSGAIPLLRLPTTAAAPTPSLSPELSPAAHRRRREERVGDRRGRWGGVGAPPRSHATSAQHLCTAREWFVQRPSGRHCGCQWAGRGVRPGVGQARRGCGAAARL